MSSPKNNNELSYIEQGRSIINMCKSGGGHDQHDKPKIQKVSYMLRRDDRNHMEKYYEPRMISIGPLHHFNDKFGQAEKLKIKLEALFIQKYSLNKDCLYKNIKKQIEDLKKKCYFEEDINGINDESLARMFVVDGCALLHYIHCDVENKLKDLKIKMDMQAFAQQDFFLLENQLPYQVLDQLINSIANPNDGDQLRKSIDKFIDKAANQIRGANDNKDPPKPAPTNQIRDANQVRGPPKTVSHCKQPIDETTSSIGQSSSSAQAAHLLELLWIRLVNYEEHHQNQHESSGGTGEPENQQHKRYSFRNVNELKAAGIKFKSDTECSLASISFTPHLFTGTLRLPSLVVNDSTAPKFLNLIAFEMCPDFYNDFQVTSYIWFLDSLIDHPDDVKELRKVHILDNALGSDEEVAKLFNEIGTDIVPNPGTYSTVKDDIQKHYEKKWKTWMAQFYHEHFSSPWTSLAFAGAILALALSFVQTWFTIFPME